MIILAIIGMVVAFYFGVECHRIAMMTHYEKAMERLAREHDKTE